MKLRSIFAGAMAVVATSAFAAIQETVTFNDVVSDGTLGAFENSITTFTSTGLTPGNVAYNLGRLDFTGTITQVNAIDYALEGRIQVKHPNGALKVIQMFSGTTFTVESGTASVFFLPTASGAGLWEFTFYESFNDADVDKIWNSLQVDYTDEEPEPAPRPDAEDKGTACDPGMSFNTAVGDSEVKWFKIEVPESTAGTDRFLDIDTETTPSGDTELGLYKDDFEGTRIADDDDGGTGLLSQLTFGPGAGNRGNYGFGGADYDGFHGDLTAGTHYLAVGSFNTTFNDTGFNVTSTGDPIETITVNIRTNMTCASVSGTVNLQNLDGDEEGCEVTFEVREVGSTTPLEVHTVTLGAGGTYEFASSLADGTYDVTAKGSHWLRKLNGSVTFAGGATNVDFDLINGDCDPDNEVNIVDAGTLAAAFGSDSESENWNELADLDKDGEVTLVDNGILAANFGQAGDE